MRFCALSGLALAVLFFCASVSSLAADDDGELGPRVDREPAQFGENGRRHASVAQCPDRQRRQKLAVNRAILQAHNDLFNHKIKAKGITDQKRSGRCWMFAALNIMRPAVIEKYKLDDFEFSLSYLAFWDKLEKANFFLETMIDFRDRDPSDREYDFFVKDPIDDGGWWDYRRRADREIRRHAERGHARDVPLGAYRRDEQSAGDEAASRRNATAADGGRKEIAAGDARGEEERCWPKSTASW